MRLIRSVEDGRRLMMVATAAVLLLGLSPGAFDDGLSAGDLDESLLHIFLGCVSSVQIWLREFSCWSDNDGLIIIFLLISRGVNLGLDVFEFLAFGS